MRGTRGSHANLSIFRTHAAPYLLSMETNRTTDKTEEPTGWRNAFSVRDSHDRLVMQLESEAYAAAARKVERR